MTDTSTAQPRRLYSKCARWWPVLIGPAALVVLVLIAEQFAPGVMKVYTEPVSPPLLGVATLVFALRAWRTGNPLCAILTGLALAFTCREIHFAGTHRGIYVALVVLVIWTIHWRKRLAVAIRDTTHVRWVASSALTYVLSMVVSRRVFSAKHLGMIPNEDIIHITLEEGLELVAHLLLLLSAFMGGWKASPRRGAPGDSNPEQAPE